MMTEEDDIKNPMMNPVVLTRFFELCSLADVLKHRLISKTWYSASLARIRNEVVVDISAGAKKKLNWSGFHKEFKVEGVPFRCFRVSKMEFGTTPSPSIPSIWDFAIEDLSQKTSTSLEEIRKNMDQFWVDHGRFIRELELAQCTVFSAEAFNKVIFEALPNLEELALGVLTNEVNEKQEESKEMGRVNLNLKVLMVCYLERAFNLQWNHLFINFPNLEKLKIINLGKDADFLSALIEACDHVDKVPLKEFHVDLLFKPTPKQAESLKELLSLRKMKLVGLTLGMDVDVNEDDDGREEEKMNIFQVALRMQGDTLRSLNLMRGPAQTCSSDKKQTYDHSEPTNNFPFRPGTLEQLTMLGMTGSVCKTLHFLRQTPNLRTLQIDATVGEDFKICLESVKNAVLPDLKELHIHEVGIPKQELEIVATIMPNVEIFHGVLDPSALRVIFKNWQKMKTLHISTSPLDEIDDEAVTGIREGCAERLPNITVLKDLRHFKIEHGKKEQLGESSVWNGFLKLPRLSFLQVQLSSKTSQEAINALQEKITDPEGRNFTLFKSEDKEVVKEDED